MARVKSQHERVSGAVAAVEERRVSTVGRDGLQVLIRLLGDVTVRESPQQQQQLSPSHCYETNSLLLWKYKLILVDKKKTEL